MIAYPNTALIGALLSTHLAGSVATMFTYFWLTTKYLFALSSDRMLHTKFPDVSDRFHTPYIAVIATTTLGAVLATLYSLPGWSTAFTLGTAIWDVAFVVPGLAVLFFPKLRKDIYQNAPGWAAKKIGGVPVISIIGPFTAALFAWLGYTAYTDPTITAPSTLSFEVVVALIVIGLDIWNGSYTQQEARVDLTLAFKQIPPE